MSERPSPLLPQDDATDKLQNDIVPSLDSFSDEETPPFDINQPPDLPLHHQFFATTLQSDQSNDDVSYDDLFGHEENNPVNFDIDQFQTSTAPSDLGLSGELVSANFVMNLGWEFQTDVIHENEENSVVFNGSGSDNWELYVENPVVGLEFDDGFDRSVDENDHVGESDEDLMLPLWDTLVLDEDNHREVNEDFEWLEVDRRDQLDEIESLRRLFEEDDLPEAEGILETAEWEVLFSLQNVESQLEMVNGHGDNHVYINAPVLRMIPPGNFVESENVVVGGPPTSRNVVENLPVVVISSEDSENGNAVCAVCKDDMSVGENAKELPCQHRYHGDCILPWLGIRNTCPVCRYELPVDDPVNETRRRQ